MPATGLLPPFLMLVTVRAMVPVAGMPPKKGTTNIGKALRQQFLIGIVFVAYHAVGHARAQKRLNRAQKRQRQGRQKQTFHRFPAVGGHGKFGQALRNAVKLAADGFHIQPEKLHRQRGRHQRHNRAGYQRQRARHARQQAGFSPRRAVSSCATASRQ